MNIRHLTTKEIGNLGELVAKEYLKRQNFDILGTNMRTRFGEIDIIAIKDDCLHVVEVKTLRCSRFPKQDEKDLYEPSQNLHSEKMRKVARLGSWYVAREKWEGEWQVDGALVWLREHDGMARIRYYPQIL